MATITAQFQEVLRTAEAMAATRRQNEALLVDGGAGTGKSTLIKLICEKIPGAVVAAPTGCAATLLGGTTVHRLFNFPLKLIEPEIDRESSFPSPVLRKMKLLIVDEVGMLRSDLIDGMDYYLRRATRRTSPFGGVGVLFVGDAFQLPPVIRREEEEILRDRLGYKSELFFDAKVWQQSALRRVELTQVFRQPDPRFVDILARIRRGEPNEIDITTINARAGLRTPANAVTLTTTREDAERINVAALETLSGAPWTSTAKIRGDFKPTDAPAQQELTLKRGCLVMLVKNNGDEWQNGTTGIFEGTAAGDLLIRADDGRLLKVGKHKWPRLRYRWNESSKAIEQVEQGSFEQYPVRLAHAITIHKAQGQTLSRVVLDLGRGVFAPGQLYVALSRSCSLDGLYLKQPISRRDCIADHRVKEFFTPKPPQQQGQEPFNLYRQRECSLWSA